MTKWRQVQLLLGLGCAVLAAGPVANAAGDPASVAAAIPIFKAAAANPAKTAAICTLLKDLDALAARPVNPKDLTAGERGMNAAIAKLPADLRAAVEAEFDLHERDRGRDDHPYYTALAAIAANCPG